MTKENEPVAWLLPDGEPSIERFNESDVPLYTHPKPVDVEPVARTIERVTNTAYSYVKALSRDIPEGTDLYRAPPDFTAKVAELEAQRDELLAALEDLCTFETPLTQDKWNFARDLIQAAKEQGK